jgi:hypothetical protein
MFLFFLNGGESTLMTETQRLDQRPARSLYAPAVETPAGEGFQTRQGRQLRVGSCGLSTIGEHRFNRLSTMPSKAVRKKISGWNVDLTAFSDDFGA